MKKTIYILVAAFFATITSISAETDSLSPEEKKALVDSYKYWKSIGSEIGSNAVKSPFGRYLVLSNEDNLLCLKLEKHLPSVKEHENAAKYSWVHLVGGIAKDSGTFVIDEDPDSDAADSGAYWIEIAGFRCEWSFGDWVYFDESLPSMKMALTEFTEEGEVDEAKIERWISRKQLASFIENDPQVKLLEKALEIEIE